MLLQTTRRNHWCVRRHRQAPRLIRRSSCRTADAGTVARMLRIDCRQGRDDCYCPNTKTSVCHDGHQCVDNRRTPCRFRPPCTRKGRGRSAADGITLNTFDSLSDLPWYSETLEKDRTPSSVEALRRAAAEADAVLIVTNYHGRVPAVVHNAIDWLTRRWDQGALHDKPLAVIGRAAGCYSGVWSHQAEDADGIAGPRVIESITVPTLREAIKTLTCEVHAGTTRPRPSTTTNGSREIR
jgi:hypothetical protein